MGKYSIKELEQLSGIKAHTIRMWEQRHKIVAPQRTHTNIRYYSDDDLKKIINVSLLNSRGIKISKIATMTFEEISAKVLGMSESKPEVEIFIDQLLVSMLDLEEQAFDTILSEIIKKFGFKRSMTEVVYPFMEKIGVLWQTGTITPAHEHFISNLIRQKLITSIAALPIPTNKSKAAILFLPEGELHEIGLLFYHYITRSKGYKTIYLGQSVPLPDLKLIYSLHRPRVLITSLISSPSRPDLEKYLLELSQSFKEATILVSGLLLRTTAVAIPKNVKPFYKATELPEILDGF